MGFFPNFVPEILVLNREEQKIQVLWPNQDTFEFSAKLLYKISHDKEPISEVKRLEYDGSCIVDLQDLKNDENVVKAFLNHIAIRGAGVVYVKKYQDHSESYNQGKVRMLKPEVIETINQLLFGVCDNQKFIHDEDLHTEGAYFENPPGIIAITNPGGVFVSDGVRIHKHMENTHSYQFLKEFKVSFSYHCNEYFFTGQHTHLGKFGDVVYCNAAKETMYCDNEYFYHLEKLKIAIITHQYFLPLTRGQILFLDNRRMLQSNGVKCYTISRN